MQLRNALWKIVKGKDKTMIIGAASSKQFLKSMPKLWKFDSTAGMIGPIQ